MHPKSRDSRLEVRDRDLKICAFWRIKKKLSSSLPRGFFFQFSSIFPTCFDCLFPANTTNIKSLHCRNFTISFLCDIQSLETCSLQDRDETWNLRDRDSQIWLSRPRQSLETPSLAVTMRKSAKKQQSQVQMKGVTFEMALARAQVLNFKLRSGSGFWFLIWAQAPGKTPGSGSETLDYFHKTSERNINVYGRKSFLSKESDTLRSYRVYISPTM